MNDLGELRYFLGIELARSSEGILLSQRKYALEMISNTGLSGSKPKWTPMEKNLKLTSSEHDLKFSTKSDDVPLEDRSIYQRLVGKLLYVTITRPDISYVAQSLSQFMHAPKKSHYEVALHVVKYIKSQPGLGLLISRKGDEKIVAYCDSDWASCPMSRRSVSGFCVKLGISLISWKSKKQNTISRSSAKAEYRCMAQTIAELTWLKGLLQEVQLPIDL
ncbi:uncharacterized mitochondrial protein AtMg00810-like [Solanum stenotomum]|uniref:uncharacterized mitochondrial protein AtMg00810-like n=1 Tax=Solanum stenotomum TaxID=172797 RepID=UPI0020D05016|nr:uncharacterized mitochondrial protein AtMg00810-like [Solanum stenotomum]